MLTIPERRLMLIASQRKLIWTDGDNETLKGLINKGLLDTNLSKTGRGCEVALALSKLTTDQFRMFYILAEELTVVGLADTFNLLHSEVRALLAV